MAEEPDAAIKTGGENMAQATSNKDIARRGQEIYESRIRALVEAEHKGKFLVLDVNSGDYEIDAEDIAAMKRARAKHPEAVFYIARIGFSSAYHLGGRLRAKP